MQHFLLRIQLGFQCWRRTAHTLDILATTRLTLDTVGALIPSPCNRGLWQQSTALYSRQDYIPMHLIRGLLLVPQKVRVCLLICSAGVRWYTRSSLSSYFPVGIGYNEGTFRLSSIDEITLIQRQGGLLVQSLWRTWYLYVSFRGAPLDFQ